MIQYNRQQKLFPLGGVACGHISFSEQGQLCDFCLGGLDGQNKNAFGAFALETREKNQNQTQIKQISGADGGFSSVEIKERFPFCTFEMADENVRVSLTGFNPFSPLTNADSEIPAAFFEVNVENISEQTKEYMVCFECGGLFDNLVTNVNLCDGIKSGVLVMTKSDLPRTNACISADTQDFSVSRKALDNGAVSHVLKAHFELAPNLSKRVRFVFCWYFPYDSAQILDGNGRNYYSQYFVSSEECSVYCHKHFERLRNTSEKFFRMIKSSTLDDNTKYELCESFKYLKALPLTRKNTGEILAPLYSQSYPKLHSELYCLCNLFPELDFGMLKADLELTRRDDNQACDGLYTVLSAYRSFLLCGDTDRLIESWFYVSRYMESIKIDNGSEEYALYALCLCLCEKMSVAVKDRARRTRYSVAAQNARAAVNASVCTVSEEIKQHAYALGVYDLFEKPGSFSGYLALNEASGFEYDGFKKSVGVSPKDELFGEDGVFTSFFCVPCGFGFVESGIDYVELKVLNGEVGVKSVKVPRKPRMVLYGGRRWRFEEKDGICVLDSLLEVTPDKKLTVIIDAAQTL